MNKKGFTLVEALAVIVVLGIIAIIATPIIMHVIRDSRKNAFGRTAEGFARTIRNHANENPELTVDFGARYSYGVLIYNRTTGQRHDWENPAFYRLELPQDKRIHLLKELDPSTDINLENWWCESDGFCTPRERSDGEVELIPMSSNPDAFGIGLVTRDGEASIAMFNDRYCAYTDHQGRIRVKDLHPTNLDFHDDKQIGARACLRAMTCRWRMEALAIASDKGKAFTASPAIDTATYCNTYRNGGLWRQ